MTNTIQASIKKHYLSPRQIQLQKSMASHNLQGEVATVHHAGKHAAFFLGKYKCDEQASMTQVTC